MMKAQKTLVVGLCFYFLSKCNEHIEKCTYECIVHWFLQTEHMHDQHPNQETEHAQHPRRPHTRCTHTFLVTVAAQQ